MRHTEGACAQESGVLDVAKAIRDDEYNKVDELGKRYVMDILTECKESV